MRGACVIEQKIKQLVGPLNLKTVHLAFVGSAVQPREAFLLLLLISAERQTRKNFT